jgi:hypothetical protein
MTRLCLRLKVKPEQYLANRKAGSGLLEPNRQWFKTFCDGLRRARLDYRKNFAGEMEETGRPQWLDAVQVEDVMVIALLRRDQWTVKRVR